MANPDQGIYNATLDLRTLASERLTSDEWNKAFRTLKHHSIVAGDPKIKRDKDHINGLRLPGMLPEQLLALPELLNKQSYVGGWKLNVTTPHRKPPDPTMGRMMASTSVYSGWQGRALQSAFGDLHERLLIHRDRDPGLQVWTAHLTLVDHDNNAIGAEVWRRFYIALDEAGVSSTYEPECEYRAEIWLILRGLTWIEITTLLDMTLSMPELGGFIIKAFSEHAQPRPLAGLVEQPKNQGWSEFDPSPYVDALGKATAKSEQMDAETAGLPLHIIG